MSELFSQHRFQRSSRAVRIPSFAVNNHQLFWGIRRAGQIKLELGFSRGDMPPAFISMTKLEWKNWLKDKPPSPSNGPRKILSIA